MSYQVKDYYFKKAKSENYVARSVFKLEEIQTRFKVLKKGDQVLDLGAAPGAWSQYTSKIIGPQGRILGIDLQPVALTLRNAVFLAADFSHVDLAQTLTQTSLKPEFDVILSDMAPKTTGVAVTDQARSLALCELALGAAQRFLKPQGTFISKLFQGEDFEVFRRQLRACFQKVELLRPASTRKASKEIFLIALSFQKK